MTAVSEVMLIHDESTWPTPLLEKLALALRILMGYEREEQAIFQEYIAPENNKPMALMSSSPFHEQREREVIEISAILQPYQLSSSPALRSTHRE